MMKQIIFWALAILVALILFLCSSHFAEASPNGGALTKTDAPQKVIVIPLAAENTLEQGLKKISVYAKKNSDPRFGIGVQTSASPEVQNGDVELLTAILFHRENGAVIVGMKDSGYQDSKTGRPLPPALARIFLEVRLGSALRSPPQFEGGIFYIPLKPERIMVLFDQHSKKIVFMHSAFIALLERNGSRVTE